MKRKYNIITLCGSTKFKEDFIRAQRELTLKGNIVISLGIFGHADNEFDDVLTEEILKMLSDIHKARIDLSDQIFVINKGGYIGENTNNEINYALQTGKLVEYMEPLNDEE